MKCLSVLSLLIAVAPVHSGEICKYRMERMDFWYFYKDITGLASTSSRSVFTNPKGWAVFCTLNFARRDNSYCETNGGGEIVGISFEENDGNPCVSFSGFYDKQGNYIKSQQKTCTSSFSNALIAPKGKNTTGNEPSISGGIEFEDTCSLKGRFWAHDYDTRNSPYQETYIISGTKRRAYVGRQLRAYYGEGKSLHSGPKGAF